MHSPLALSLLLNLKIIINFPIYTHLWMDRAGKVLYFHAYKRRFLRRANLKRIFSCTFAWIIKSHNLQAMIHWFIEFILEEIILLVNRDIMWMKGMVQLNSF